MPGREVHAYVDKLLFGRSYWRIHREMDRPYKYLGKSHRILFHDPVLAYMIAGKQYPDDVTAIAAAQCHIALDNLCTRNPGFKRILIGFAKRDRKKKKSRQVLSTAGLCFTGPDPLFDGLRQLADLFSSATALSVDPILIELLGKRMHFFLTGAAAKFA